MRLDHSGLIPRSVFAASVLAVCLSVGCGAGNTTSSSPTAEPSVNPEGPEGTGAKVPATLEDDTSCVKDADCIVTSFSSCCSCPGNPHPMNVSILRARERQCTVVDCTISVSCGRAGGGNPQDLNERPGVCRDRHCAMR